jgi:hypothetical protein
MKAPFYRQSNISTSTVIGGMIAIVGVPIHTLLHVLQARVSRSVAR